VEIAVKSQLKGGDFVNVALEDGQLYAGTQCELFCLDPATGKVRWHNKLFGLGLGLITFARSADGNLIAMEEKRRREAAAATSTVVATT
jgi:outer membrane protein assembly factor BamB